jgi:AcrR family transcriptional regulator
MTALPNRDRRAERREATRREILDAAWEIARSDGLATLTMRAVAERIGMRSPSLYGHFESKNAIYDGMFGQAWEQVLELYRGAHLPKAPRRRLLTLAEQFFDFSVADLARYQLINQRTIPDFRPSDEAYAPSQEAMALFRQSLAEVGITAQADIDLNTGIVSGFIDQQLANDPGGVRWRNQLPRVIDMYADAVGLPGPRLRRTRRP